MHHFYRDIGVQNNAYIHGNVPCENGITFYKYLLTMINNGFKGFKLPCSPTVYSFPCWVTHIKIDVAEVYSAVYVTYTRFGWRIM